MKLNIPKQKDNPEFASDNTKYDSKGNKICWTCKQAGKEYTDKKSQVCRDCVIKK